MSIASRIEAIEEHITDIYDTLEKTGVEETDKNIININSNLEERLEYFLSNGLDVLWNNWEKVTGTGQTLSLQNTLKGKMYISPKGNTIQNGTPTPTSPIPIQVVTGNNNIDICGKNLLDIQGIVKGRLDNGVIGYESNTTNLTLNDNSFSFTTNANYRGATSDYIPLSENCILHYNNLNSEFNITIACYDSSKTWLGNAAIAGLANENIRTISIANGTKYVRIYFYLASAGTIIIEKPQLEKGSTATTYEPYTGDTYSLNLGDIELCKIGTYQDYIYKDNGKWYLHKEIGKVVLNGSEADWGTQTGTTGFYRYYATINDINVSSTLQNEIIVKSNYFKGITFLNRNTDTNETIYVPTNNGTQYLLYFNTNIATTLANFKTWLGNNNTIAYYVLATPTNTEITDNELINELEAFKSKTGITNISQDGIMELDVVALKKEV